VRLGHFLGKLQNRKVALPGSLVAGPCWSHFFLVPPLPLRSAASAFPGRAPGQPRTAVERFGRRWDACKKYGVTTISNASSERRWATPSRCDYINHMLHPEHPIDAQKDVCLIAAKRWATVVSKADFQQITGKPSFRARCTTSSCRTICIMAATRWPALRSRAFM